MNKFFLLLQWPLNRTCLSYIVSVIFDNFTYIALLMFLADIYCVCIIQFFYFFSVKLLMPDSLSCIRWSFLPLENHCIVTFIFDTQWYSFFYITAHTSAILSDMSFSGEVKDDRKYIDHPFNIVCHIRLLYVLLQ